jgi:predicted RNase H-like nuclease (RuvC/YqgF family)
MLTPSTPSDDEIVTLQMAQAYRALALESVHYLADRTTEVRRYERTIDSLRERLAEKDAEIAALKAEIARYTRSQVAASEAA